MSQRVAVFGAYGHTGRFVVTELRERGFVPLPLGRDARKLAASGLPYRVASVEDPASLDQALTGVDAVINCAGPFASTAAPVIEAALRAGIPYVDVAAEIEANLDTFAHFTVRAKEAGGTVVSATCSTTGWPATSSTTCCWAASSSPWRSSAAC
ncbi:NAD(P)H-binding protein [Micromonospora sp. NPDC005215]|uniref:NAD(P)H-binding protein n=1 Tax=Micromonospora sp. NPDC005215 TaxID=3157024 RepID=UPI0033AFB5CB